MIGHNAKGQHLDGANGLILRLPYAIAPTPRDQPPTAAVLQSAGLLALNSNRPQTTPEESNMSSPGQVARVRVTQPRDSSPKFLRTLVQQRSRASSTPFRGRVVFLVSDPRAAPMATQIGPLSGVLTRRERRVTREIRGHEFRIRQRLKLESVSRSSQNGQRLGNAPWPLVSSHECSRERVRTLRSMLSRSISAVYPAILDLHLVKLAFALRAGLHNPPQFFPGRFGNRACLHCRNLAGSLYCARQRYCRGVIIRRGDGHSQKRHRSYWSHRSYNSHIISVPPRFRR